MDDSEIRTYSNTEWAAICASARQPRVLDNGALVDVITDPDVPVSLAIQFYATAANAPIGWNFPFVDIDARGTRRSRLGFARFVSNGRVALEVTNTAAVEALSADYEGGITDLDEPGFEAAIEVAFRGSPNDTLWLKHQFRELMQIAHG